MQNAKRILIWPGLLLALLLGLAAVPVAQARNHGTGVITGYAPGAPVNAPSVVQWSDNHGNWFNVEGWRGTLDNITPQGVPFKRWTVFEDNFGQDFFRWVVFNADGKTVWGISATFALPDDNGKEVVETIAPSGTASSQPVLATPIPVAPAGPATVLTANSFTFGTGCFGSNCHASQISAYITGQPASSWIAVDWQDGTGAWHPVDGWQGLADSVDKAGVLFKQWNFGPAVYGRGPFRWAIYSAQGGRLAAVSPSFMMPPADRLNFIMQLGS